MNKRFPHLTNSNDFPGVNNVDPFRIQNRFDYTRWDIGTTLKVLNVNWCGDFENVVKFEDDAVRDAWFDNVPGDSVQLDTPIRVLPGQSIKLPLPVDELYKYNYLMVDLSTATSDDRPIAFETNEHLSRFYYFIDDCSYIAPNTTEARVTLDVWTTFINRIQINYMMLERGHAPAAAVKVRDYLANPVANNAYLLAPDVNAGGDPAIGADGSFIPFGSGSKYILFATSAPLDSLPTMAPATSLSAVPAQFEYYADEAWENAERFGAPYGSIADATNVYAAGGADYSNARAHVDTLPVQNGVAVGYSVFAIAATDAEQVQGFAPQFLESIAAAFVVDEVMITLGDSFEIPTASGTVQAFHVKPNDTVLSQISLTPDNFGYPSEFAGFAKLYTYPYACLEISNDDGDIAIIKIEDVGVSPAVVSRVAIAYPYMRFEAFIENVGGGAPIEYKWRDVAGTEHAETLPGGDFKNLMFGYDIPTFPIFMAGYDAYALHNFNSNNTIPQISDKWEYQRGAWDNTNAAKNSYQKIENSYNISIRNADVDNKIATKNIEAFNKNTSATIAQNKANAFRSAENSYSTSKASADTALDNANASADAGYTNATASNATAKDNTDASNATSLANANASADAAYSNSSASAATNLENSNASAETSKANATLSANNAQANANDSADAAYTNTNNSNNTNTANNMLEIAASIANITETNEAAATTTKKVNSLHQAVQAWNSGYSRQLRDIENAQAMVSMAGNIASGVVSAGVDFKSGHIDSAIKGGANTINNTIQSIASVAAGNAATEAGIELTQAQVDESSKNATELMNINTNLATTTLNRSNTLSGNIVKNNNNLAETNAKNTQKTAKSNAARTHSNSIQTASAAYDTSIANNQRSNDTALVVAATSRDTTKANAVRTNTTTAANAVRSKETADANAENTRDTSKANATRTHDTALANAKLVRSVAETNAKGTADTSTANLQRDVAAREYAAGMNLTRANQNAFAVKDTDTDVTEYNQDLKYYELQKNLDVKGELARAAYLDHRTDKAVQIGSNSGDATPDAMRWRGLQIRYKTQRDGEIAQAGSAFLRYGYSFNQQWNLQTLTPMPHFSYWKCSDLWLVGGDGVIESAQRVIKEIFSRGVTIWKDPEEIGAVSIFDNALEV